MYFYSVYSKSMSERFVTGCLWESVCTQEDLSESAGSPGGVSTGATKSLIVFRTTAKLRDFELIRIAILRVFGHWIVIGYPTINCLLDLYSFLCAPHCSTFLKWESCHCLTSIYLILSLNCIFICKKPGYYLRQKAYSARSYIRTPYHVSVCFYTLFT